jgi:hypothetical protein
VLALSGVDMSEFNIDHGFEAQCRDSDFILSICDECGTPPDECELCLSDAYKKCPKIVAAIKQCEEIL